MFFSKKSQNSSENNDEAVTKRGIKKMDAMITGAILGGVVASLYGVKKLKDSREKGVENSTPMEEKKPWFFEKIFSKK